MAYLEIIFYGVPVSPIVVHNSTTASAIKALPGARYMAIGRRAVGPGGPGGFIALVYI